MIMYDYYTMKIVFMKNVIYDFCNYDKRIMKNIFMTKVLWLLLLRLLRINRYHYNRSKIIKKKLSRIPMIIGTPCTCYTLSRWPQGHDQSLRKLLQSKLQKRPLEPRIFSQLKKLNYSLFSLNYWKNALKM